MRQIKRRYMLVLPALLLLLGILVVPAGTRAQGGLSPNQRATLHGYAADTWQSFVDMTFPSGLPADNIDAAGNRSLYTSPTNIGAYMWSTLAARDMRLITPAEARQRVQQTLTSVAGLERHPASGQFYNWYNPATGAKLTAWPVDNGVVYPFLSSVDNGWLATALIMVGNGMPALRGQAQAILEDMDFGFYYDPAAGLLRGGFWDAPPPGCSTQGNYRQRGPDVFYTCHHYGTLNTEPRIASYIGIAWGQVPATHYFKMWRTFPDTCDWSWPEMKPEGVMRNYLGVDVYEGHYTYRGLKLVPTWGGSMFEALMVTLFVPEEQWGPQSWGVNHPIYVQAQIEHGMNDAQYGYWGFSPSTNPDVPSPTGPRHYREYGVDAIGMNTDGYASNNDDTLVDYGFPGCPGREPKPVPPASAYTNGVVTPHAVFLALPYAPQAAFDNLERLRQNFDAYGPGGFYDAVNVSNGAVSRYYLALDQGMIMAAIDNAVRADRMRQYFTPGPIEAQIRPLLEMEEFTAGGD